MPAQISSMEYENILQRLNQLLKGQAEIKEMFRQSLLGQNTGANAVSSCEMDVDVIEEKDEVEDATLYIRLGDFVCNTTTTLAYDFTWFVMPSRGVVDSERLIDPCFTEPRHIFENTSDGGGSLYTPLVVGPYIFIISSAIKASPPERLVFYKNTQKKEEDWMVGPTLVGEHAILCHFIVADEKIYAFGAFDNGYSLRVSSIDYKELDKGWKVKENAVNGGSILSRGLFESFYCIDASTIEYGTTGTRALIFAGRYRITYEFETNSYFFSEECLNRDAYCSVCPEGREIFFLIQDSDNSLNIRVYDQQNRKWCMTPVSGLNKYLPVANKYTLPLSRLVHLGNKRLCLVSAHFFEANTEVRCTKFSVRVQQEGEYHATKVSYQVYKVKEINKYEFEAVVVNKMVLDSAEDNASGVGFQSKKRKESIGVKQKRK